MVLSVSLKNAIVAPILLLAALAAGYWVGQNGVEFEAWGGLFILGASVLLTGFVLAHWLSKKHHHKSAIFVDALCAVLLTAGGFLYGPDIDWSKSLALVLFVIGLFVSTFILAINGRSR